MSDVALAVYAGIGVVVAVVVLAAAFRFANAAKKGSMRFARRQRSAHAKEHEPERAHED